LPNFRETDPSKIVVGFGGSVNMVTGLLFIVCVIGLMAIPFHVANLTSGVKGGTSAISPWVFAGVPIGVILGSLAAVVPLRAGGRALRGMEF
jgi:ABC-2 type transport system permease protein